MIVILRCETVFNIVSIIFFKVNDTGYRFYKFYSKCRMEFVGMEQNENKKSRDFNIYYLNFSKVYEIAMMINNVILTKIETDNSSNFEEQYGFTSSVSAKGTKSFLDGIKASISTEAKESVSSSSRVVESLDVKTTKSILLRRVIEQCASVNSFSVSAEGDLVKVDRVKLELLDEDSLRQFLVLRRDALKGMQVEGVEVNNLVSSMLQDYAYILKGSVASSDSENAAEIIMVIRRSCLYQCPLARAYTVRIFLYSHIIALLGCFVKIFPKNFRKNCAICSKSSALQGPNTSAARPRTSIATQPFPVRELPLL